MGALCWVLPMEEDWETLEEEEEDGGEVFPGVGLLERLLRLLDKVASCLGCWRPADGVVLLVNGLLVDVELKFGVEEMITSVFCALDFLKCEMVVHTTITALRVRTPTGICCTCSDRK